MLNFNLTAEQLEIQKMARAFALKEILPLAWYYDDQNQTPLPLLQKAFTAGLMNTDIPKQFGGKGYGILEATLMTEEVAAACPGIATSLFDNSLGMEPLLLSKNDSAKQKYLPEILKSFKLICFATSEPWMGSDIAGIRCLAQKEGQDYILTGTKYWITNGGIADYISVFATVDPQSRHKGVCAFLVEKSWPGVYAGETIPKLGQRCSNTTGLYFDHVRVAKENVLAAPGEGFMLAMKTFGRTRPVIGAFGVGAARSAMEFAIDYAKKRRAFETNLANFEAIQFKIAEMYQKIETARLLVWKAALEADRGLDPTISGSIAKLYGSEAALEVVNEALQIMGGYGYTKMFPLEKLLRDIRLLRIYEGTSEIQRSILAEYALKAYKPIMPALEDLPIQSQRDPSAADSTEPAWRCRLCGHVHYGPTPPEKCPYCFAPDTAFKRQG